jgi:hypothetical protein
MGGPVTVYFCSGYSSLTTYTVVVTGHLFFPNSAWSARVDAIWCGLQ